MTHATNMNVPCKTVEVNSVYTGLGRLFLASLNRLQVWYERSRQRRHLARLDDRLLDDIGIDRSAAMEEASKPFWIG